LVREILELHGGRLKVSSELGRGSNFRLEIPRVRPLILIVDDDPRFRGIQVSALKRLDVDIVEAGGGGEALEVLKDQTPHLIVSDVEMPELNGLELLKRLKAAATTKNIPVIMVCGGFDTNVRETVSQLGAEDFVTKAEINTDDFISRVKRYVG
jgi:CheY-like chemotaxis protein